MTILNKGDGNHSFTLQLRDNGNTDNRGFLQPSSKFICGYYMLLHLYYHFIMMICGV